MASNDFGLSMADYHSYDDMVAFMKRVHSALPGNTKIVSIGRTVEGREIQGIQVTEAVINLFVGKAILVWRPT